MWFALPACHAGPPPARIVAVGDLHSDPAAALDVLAMAGLVDPAGRWSGGTATLVQTGDLLDRGPDSRGILALFRRLLTEATAAGGRVVALNGNHEVMNLQGDWRYVSEPDLAGYGGEAARKAAFAPTGQDGTLLRSWPVVAEIGGTVFAHGGIDAHWATFGVDGLNGLARAALDGGPPAIFGPDGPLWNRSHLLSEEAVACPQVALALERLGASRMVVGHTTQDSGRIASRCEGRLWGIDTGISTGYGHHLSALEIVGDRVTPLYPPAPG